MILLLTFLIALLACYALGLAAPQFRLMAHPGEHRKHQMATPLVGGIAIFISVTLGLVITRIPELKLLPSLVLLFVVGVIDDRYKLPSWSRFLAQALATYLMIEFTGVQLTSLGSLFGQAELQLGIWSMPVTVFAVIGVINAVNMSDGLDGQSGLLVILTLLCMLYLGSQAATFLKLVVASILGFLCWNIRLGRPYAAIFMGDAGSTVLGLIVAYCLIDMSQAPMRIIPPVTALWLLALPLIDAVAVLLVRPLRGYSPFSADRLHYHHLLQARGLSVNTTLAAVIVGQSTLVIIGMAMLFWQVQEHYQLWAFLVIFGVYFMRLFFVSAELNEVSKK